MDNAPTTEAIAASSGWRETFFDGFDGWHLDRAAWPVLFGGGSTNGAYTWSPSAVLPDGTGNLLVRNQITDSGWVAGGVNQGWNAQQYGRYEVHARMEPGWGTAFVIGLWPADGEYPPEVDMIETPTPDRQIGYSVVHWEDETGDNDAVVYRFEHDSTRWHTYTLDWLPDRLTLYIDGREMWTQTHNVPDEPMTLNLTGHVGREGENWTWGAPNASTPPIVNMQVDWVRISTPEEFWPGNLPVLAHDGVAPATLRTGMRALDGENHAAAWDGGEWGGAPALRSAPAAWGEEDATRLAYANHRELQLDLRAAGMRELDVKLIGAQRGRLDAAEGDDAVTWVAHSDAPGEGNVFAILTGSGADEVTVTSAAASWLDQPFGHGGSWNYGYDGSYSLALIDTGPGSDRVVLEGGVGARILLRPGDGQDRVEGFTPGLHRLEMVGIDPASVTVRAGTEEGVAGTLVSYGAGDEVFLAGATSPGDILYSDPAAALPRLPPLATPLPPEPEPATPPVPEPEPEPAGPPPPPMAGGIEYGAAGVPDAFTLSPGMADRTIQGWEAGLDSLVFEGIDPAAVTVAPGHEGDAWGLRVTYGPAEESVFLRWAWEIREGDMVFA